MCCKNEERTYFKTSLTTFYFLAPVRKQLFSQKIPAPLGYQMAPPFEAEHSQMEL